MEPVGALLALLSGFQLNKHLLQKTPIHGPEKTDRADPAGNQ